MNTFHFPLFKKLILSFFLLIGIFSTTLKAQPCSPDFITLNSQAKVNDFQANHGPCDQVVEILTIKGAGITDLSPLIGLVKCKDLIIQNCPNLTTLDGLDNLTTITRTLLIRENNSLADLSALSSLTKVGQMVLEGTLTTDFAFASNITTLLRFTIRDNTELTDIDDLTSLTSITSGFTIVNNDKLLNIDGLSSASINLDQGWVEDNKVLTNVDGLKGITKIKNSLSIENNKALTNVDGLANLITAHVLDIQDNPKLENLDSLAALTKVSERLRIQNNNSLTTLEGLNNLNSNLFRLIININDNLSDCCAIEEWINTPGKIQHIDISYNQTGCDNQSELTDYCTDDDMDGYTIGAGDCDDSDPEVNPGEVEVLCDGKDNDCDPETPDGTFCCTLPDPIVFVDKNATSGANDGTSWTDAYLDLQDALSNLGPEHDTVWVAEGTYYPTVGTDRNLSFTLINDVAIIGSFISGHTCLQQSDPMLHPSILSGDIGVQGDSSDNSYHVIFNDGGGINLTAVLNGFVIEEGNADGTGDGAKGGGMFNDNASPTVRNCHFKNNHADFGGGGLYNKTSGALVENCRFSNNDADIGGGAFNSIDVTAEYTTCYFYNNTATDGGGGMFNNSALLCSVTNCLFEQNNVATDGGGIYNLNSSPDIINSAFLANEADEGAGISNRGGSSPNIINCSLHANSAIASGGGIRNHTGTIPLIINCILWGNIAGLAGDEISNAVPGPIVSYSIIKQATGTYPGTGNLNEDPLFEDSSDLNLQSCSPAINAGSNIANGTTQDLVGNPRKHGVIDMGAYEYQGSPTSTSIIWQWDGESPQQWNISANWNTEVEPAKCQHVLIPTGNTVVVPAFYEALGRTLDVESGAELLADPDATMDNGN